MSAKTNVSFRTVWGVCMALAYTGIACVVLFTPLLLRYNGANLSLIHISEPTRPY